MSDRAGLMIVPASCLIEGGKNLVKQTVQGATNPLNSQSAELDLI